MIVDKPVYVTEKGKAELEAELEQLRTEERPELVERLHEAKDGADWMDNTEGMLIQDELAFVEGRINEIERMLANAQLIEEGDSKSVVQIGDTAVIQPEDGDELEEYTIVGVAESDPTAGLISNESPLAQALLDHQVGEEVCVETPDGEFCYRIVAVK